jgi:cytosine/adenosine deaminase-related metal-dependent hydrolase
MTETVWIRNAAWVIAWDDAARSHAYLRDGDVVFRGADIVFVGRGWAGTADRVIDGQNRLVLPGLIDLHAHPSLEPAGKGMMEELASPALWMNRLYEFLFLMWPSGPEGAAVSLKVAVAELLKSGCTTFVDMSMAWDGWLDTLAETGIRAYAGPLFGSARWRTPSGHRVVWDWAEDDGRGAMARALAVIDEAERHPSGRLRGIVTPTTIDTCSAELLQASLRTAEERHLPIQLHAAQSMVEVQEIIRRTGRTPIDWLSSLGFLTPRTIIGHGIFLDHHPWLHWHAHTELELLARSGATIVHCPLAFAMRGVAMHDFGRYRDAGVNMTIGTDTYPHNMMEEMRWTGVLAKVARGHVAPTRAGDLFHAATADAARALGRSDLGRLAIGAKADIVLVDLAHPTMRPLRDPLKSLIYTATDRAVRDVFVDGRQVLADGEVTRFDLAQALDRLQEEQQLLFARIPSLDWAGRSIDDLAPLSLPPHPACAHKGSPNTRGEA